jgi:hypothetical protein
MKLQLFSENCAASTCPTVFRTDRGTFVVQGKILQAEAASGLTLSHDETAVEIPESLLTNIVDKLATLR